MDAEGSDELICVYETNAREADVIRTALEGSGIPAAVTHAGSSAYPVSVGAFGAGRVMVRAKDRNAALEIITVALGGGSQIDEGPEPGGRSWVVAAVTTAIALVLVILLFWAQISS